MLIEETLKFQVDTEPEAADIIEEYKQNQKNDYILTKAGYIRKEVKSKKEVIGEYYIVTVIKRFN